MIVTVDEGSEIVLVTLPVLVDTKVEEFRVVVMVLVTFGSTVVVTLNGNELEELTPDVVVEVGPTIVVVEVLVGAKQVILIAGAAARKAMAPPLRI